MAEDKPQQQQNQNTQQQQPQPATARAATAAADESKCSEPTFDQQPTNQQAVVVVNKQPVDSHNQPVRVSFSQSQVDEELVEMARRAKQHKKWNRRLKIFFCCLGYKKNKDSIADIASIFAEFYSDLNVPSTDIAAGFVLLSKYQEAQRQWILKHNKSSSNTNLPIEQFLSGVPVTEKTKFLDIKTAEDSHLVNDLIYYMNYSLAIFGWPLQAFEDPCTLCCIYPYLRPVAPCSSSRRRKSSSQQQQQPQPDQDEHSIDRSNKEAAVDNSKQQKKRSSMDEKKKPEEKRLTGESNREDYDEQQQQENSVPAANNDDNNDDKDRKKKKKSKSSNTVPVGQLDEDCNRPIILEDNCCSCNVASAGRRLAAHNYEIIYVSYRVAVNVVPFLVAADHARQTIVVAIRGSMSLSDMVTDMNGTIDKLPIENCPDDWLCHRGITKAANYVKTTLNEEHILDRAFNCRPDLGSQEYDLIFCGHSLGAGAAAILGVLMRPQYPTLKAYLYSPPGGILSLPVVEYTKQFAIGIILGNDTVPRLGMAQLERLKYHILLSLKSSERSTRKVLASHFCPSFCFGKNKVDYDPTQSLDLLHGTEANPFDYNGIRVPFQVQQHVLYVPGRLIHVVKNHSFKSKTRRLFNEPIYQAIWTNNEDYDRFLIGEGMLLDHLPHNLMHSMKMLFSNTLPGRRESKQQQQAQTNAVVSSIPNGNLDANVPQQQADICSKIGQPLATDKHEPKQQKILVDSDDNNNNETDENNNNDSEELNRKLYPHLDPHRSSNEILYQRQADEIKKIGQDLDENGNEKTSL